CPRACCGGRGKICQVHSRSGHQALGLGGERPSANRTNGRSDAVSHSVAPLNRVELWAARRERNKGLPCTPAQRSVIRRKAKSSLGLSLTAFEPKRSFASFTRLAYRLSQRPRDGSMVSSLHSHE